MNKNEQFFWRVWRNCVARRIISKVVSFYARVDHLPTLQRFFDHFKYEPDKWWVAASMPQIVKISHHSAKTPTYFALTRAGVVRFLSLPLYFPKPSMSLTVAEYIENFVSIGRTAKPTITYWKDKLKASNKRQKLK